jgi:hypothetical protein
MTSGSPMSPPVCGASHGELAREDHGDDLTFRAGYFHGLVAALGRRGNAKGSAAPAATWALQGLHADDGAAATALRDQRYHRNDEGALADLAITE